MKSRTVAIIGGGPAGLFAARLLKLNQPELDVTVYERNGADAATFGFGVGLTEATMTNVSYADPTAAAEIRKVSYAGHDLHLRHDGGASCDLRLHGARNLAIGRATLLEVLSGLARAAEVTIRQDARVTAAELDADVIIAADGARSATRTAVADAVGFNETHGRGWYMWCGVDIAVPSAFFSSHSHGDALFVAHAYPYARNHSTFLLEADNETWEQAGLEEFDRATPNAETDKRSVRLLEDVFSEDLQGRPLLTNRSRWARFSTIGLERWSVGNTVFIGDAAHTAHYTLGSGTKLALEDAIALEAALRDHNDLEDAFAAYETARRPYVERFQRLASRSQRWWESYRLRNSQPAELLALSYMTRAGNLTVADFARHEPDTTVAALRHLGNSPPSDPDRINDWILAQATVRPDIDAPQQRIYWSTPDPWGADAGYVLSAIPSGRAVHVDGPDDPVAISARIDLAERISLTTSNHTIVRLPESARGEAAAAIAAKRCEAVEFGEPPTTSSTEYVLGGVRTL